VTSSWSFILQLYFTFFCSEINKRNGCNRDCGVLICCDDVLMKATILYESQWTETAFFIYIKHLTNSHSMLVIPSIVITKKANLVPIASLVRDSVK